MKILVCGSRTLAEEHRVVVEVVLDGWYQYWTKTWSKILKNDERFEVISGAAPGADTFGAVWARRLVRVPGARVDLVEVPADWDRYGKAAGPKRNQVMLELKPDLGLAFVDKLLAESRGTQDMVRRLAKANVQYVVHELH